MYVIDGKCTLVYLDTKNLDDVVCYPLDNPKKLDITVEDRVNKLFTTIIDGKKVYVEALNKLYYQTDKNIPLFESNTRYMLFDDGRPYYKDINYKKFTSTLYDLTSYYEYVETDRWTNHTFQYMMEDKNKSISIGKLLKCQDKLNDILQSKIEKNKGKTREKDWYKEYLERVM